MRGRMMLTAHLFTEPQRLRRLLHRVEVQMLTRTEHCKSFSDRMIQAGYVDWWRRRFSTGQAATITMPDRWPPSHPPISIIPAPGFFLACQYDYRENTLVLIEVTKLKV